MINNYGSWKSPITSDLIVSETIGLSSIVIDNSHIYWLESRPQEKGRTVIVCQKPDGKIYTITPSGFSVRSRCHEYGGSAYNVVDGKIYFINDRDQYIYVHQIDREPEIISSQIGGKCLRYADMIIDRIRNRLICVHEDHQQRDLEPLNTIISIDLNSPQQIQTLVSGSDFYSNPKLSPDGKKLVWLSWNHPNMPWDGTALTMANVHPDGSLSEYQLIAGSISETIFQPEWSPNGILHFISNRTGWGNIYRYENGEVKSLFPANIEFSTPQWIFGLSTYGFVDENEIICTFTQGGNWHLASLDCLKKEYILADNQ